MSGFGVFQKINRKLDEGWKMTNVECPICKTIIVGHPTTKELFCVKCDMPVKFEKEEEDYEVEVVGSDPKSSPQEVPKEAVADEDDFDNMVVQRQIELKRKRADELSKKMGELLLQGWAMLEECCETCLFPLMRSKKGELICVGCGPVKSEEEKLAEQKKALEEEENKRKAEMKKEEKSKSPMKTPAVASKVAKKVESDSSEEEVIQSKKEKKNKPQAKKVKEESDSSSSSSDSESEDEKVKCKKMKPEKKKELYCDKKEKKNEKIKDKKKKYVPCDKEKEENQSCSNRNFSYNYEVGQFQESIDFYTKMTQQLSEDFEKLSTIGLLSSLDKVKTILKLQKKIDQNKLELIRNLKK